MELREALLGAVEGFGTFVRFDLLVEGEERVLLASASKVHRESTEAVDRLAWEIADFLPIALARVDLIQQGARLDDHYGRTDSHGRLRTYRLLSEEPVYRECQALAPELFATQKELAERLAQLSVERQMFDAALARGSRIENLHSGPPILNGPDELCDPLDKPPTFSEKPFWLVELEKRNRPWWKWW
ncbi:MAG TPA: hypothetical protein VGN57_01150 [Pirellulaceae bacterium]|jgi:hypothetical protein|nr:hypothetical protein [Pirellulaceae bacterium]